MQFQSECLDDKFQRSLAKISEWYSRWNNEVYVSFSGGKDSTVLADICAVWCKASGATLYLAFVNTGLEYPEIQRFVKEYAQYLREKYDIEVVLEILRPKMRFDEVIKNYGYPIISKEVSECVSQGRNALERDDGTYNYRLLKLQGKALDKEGRPSLFNRQKYEPLLYTDFLCSHQCCNVMKKKPAKQYAKQTGRKPITAQMAEESNLRTQQWLKNGCNGFNMTSPISNPMSFWTEQDVFQYIKEEQLPIASVYGDIVYAKDPEQMRFDFGTDCGTEKLQTTGCDRTGCIFCAFGCHLEKEPSRFQRLKETHPKQYEYCIGGGEYNEDGIWQPNKKGLGMGHVFDELNKIYGDGFIKY
jgi:3'-phosphoadenosine 5'-phosphosulfate sulfotransferase (PAPS reductase)/FAD synthetase